MKKKNFTTNYFLILLLILFSVSIKAQTPVIQSLDTIKKDSVPELKYNFKNNQQGDLYLTNPSNTEVIYDAELDKYIIIEKIGTYYISKPIYMTQKEYEAYRLKKDMLQYYKDKLNAVGGKSKDKSAQKDLLPSYYVNSSFFESIFGGNTIEVNPQGSINIQLGMLYQKVDNPQLSERNRSSLTFDFDQQISASILAKVGTRLKVTANYDTQATFNFENLIKLEYTPNEDDILQKIEVGNVSMPIRNSLITGAQSLFGFKTQLKFGKTTVTGVFAEQKSQTRSVSAQGGSTLNEFELQTTDYDADRHFFLSQYFRDTYNSALVNFPLVNSPINITRVEVWVTNRNQSTQDVRNIVAMADLAEGDEVNNIGPANVSQIPGNVVVNTSNGEIYPSNEVNTLNNVLTATGPIRNISTVSNGLLPYNMQQGRDYSVLENARRLQPSDYKLHPTLGFISLNRRLAESDVLAVAYEYTISGDPKVYRVGEFTSDGIIAPDNIVVKLLRSEIININIPLWDMMMKNAYALPNAYRLQREGFRLELLYKDDATGVPINTLQNAQTNGISNKTLLNLFEIDKLDQNNYSIPDGDGYFDFVEGTTIDSEKGILFFPIIEPFGSDLLPKLTDTADANYVFEELYDLTQSEAKNNFQQKDKYLIKGYHKSENANGIPLGAFNVPQGSVRVTSGGRELVEGVDYVVDYQIGRVQIINPSLEASNAPIEVSVENNSAFNLQTKRFIGVDVEHQFSDKFVAGFSFLNLNEKPITQKAIFGSEPINNTIIGLNASYGSEIPLFTKLANKLPNVETDVPSNFSIRGDFAYLMPGSPKGIELQNEATSYVDDFEGSQIPLDIKSPLQWYLASTPQYQTETHLRNLGGDLTDNLAYGYKRGKLAWYIIDQLMYNGSSQPNSVNDSELSRAEVRRVRFEELFPEQDLDITQSTVVRTLDLAFYPSERGSYNYNTADDANGDGKFDNPEEFWGGVTRPLTTTNFEQSNVEYIQFWMMDPYDHYSITQEEGLPPNVNPNDPLNQVGELYFNLGNISEDVLKDGRKMYENGLPENELDNANTAPTIWGKVPTDQSLLYTFDDKDQSRLHQDIGLDGLTDDEERAMFPALANLEDPASDNYRYFRGSEYDADGASVLTRYKAYNNTQGNSPTSNLSPENYPTSATSYPDVEDINKDQTMNSVESYYQYKVSLNKDDLKVGENNIVDEKIVKVTLDDGTEKEFKWYQFRIQVNTPDEVINGITGFQSIRFMRMFLTKFKMPVVLRLGELQLVRGDWRRYTKTLDETIVPQQNLTNSELQSFEVGVVNIQENERRTPIPYVLPPGIKREILQGSTTLQKQNEQALTVKVTDLEPNQTRAIYKNVSVDLRMYKKLKMFLHAEGVQTRAQVGDDEILAIIRFGSDLNDNYYQFEMPLKISDYDASTALSIWPEENNLETILENLGQLKLTRFEEGIPANILYPAPVVGEEPIARVRVKGNPNLGNIKTIMLGINNTSNTEQSAEVWFNELRVSEFDNEGGWAAVVSADANFADVADVSVTGRMETKGFGGIEQRVNERSQEDTKLYDVVTNINVGKMLPKKWNLQVPLNYSIAEEFRDPKYDAQYQDVLFEDAKDINPNSKNSRDYTKRRSFNLINVRKERNPNSEKKQRPYDVENLSVSYAYNETSHKDYNVERYKDQNVRASANYNYSFKEKVIEPFKNSEVFKSKYLRFLKDLNINLLPSTVSINSNIIRSYNEQLSRSLVEGLPQLPSLEQRNFMFDWDYNIGYNLTKSLQFNFRAANNYVYDDFNSEDVQLFDNFFNIGRADHYHQSLSGTYKIPLDKIPFLSFIKANYGYTADFDWQASSQSYVDQIGNTIQNLNSHNLTVDLSMSKFYKTLGLDKLLLKKDAKKTTQKGTAKLNASKAKNAKAKPKNKVAKGVYDVLTSIKNARFSYSENNGTYLPGYVPEVGFLGRDNYSGSLAPTLGFVFGSQVDIRNKSIENGWLLSRDANDPYYNKTYSVTHLEKLDATIDLEPFKDLDIEITGNRIYTSNMSQQIDVVNGVLNSNAPISDYGNFSISHNMVRTAFSNDDKTFQEFKDYRTEIANRLASETGYDVSGYGVTNQDVMLPAFLAAYSGQSASKVKLNPFRDIPLPNWNISYKGFMKMKWFKKRFQSFSVGHSYRSSYSITSYANNLQYQFNEVANQPEQDLIGNYFSKTLFTNVNLIDEFSPLIKLDVKMKNSFSFSGRINKDRALTLNLNNNTLTQISGTEYVFGLGYRLKDLAMNMRFGGKKTRLKGDLNLRADISYRNNETAVRAIDTENDQVTGGQRLLSLKFLADYALSKSLIASFYFDQSSSRYAISTTFPRQSFSSGFSVRYNLGN